MAICQRPQPTSDRRPAPRPAAPAGAGSGPWATWGDRVVSAPSSPPRTLGRAGDGVRHLPADGALPNASASWPATACRARAHLLGLQQPPRCPAGGRTQRQAALPAGLDRAQEPAGPPATGVSWKAPRVLALPGSRPEGQQLEPFRGAQSPLSPQPAQLARGVAPLSPASAEFGLPESSCRRLDQAGLASAGVQTIIYYPIPNPPPAGLCRSWLRARQPAAPSRLTLRKYSACRSSGTDAHGAAASVCGGGAPASAPSR